MKKLFTVLVMLVSVSAWAGLGFSDLKYTINLYDNTSIGNQPDTGLITTGALVFVYTAGTKTLATLYSDNKRTSLANPITRTQFAVDDQIKFWGTANSYDLVVYLSDGSCGRYSSVGQNTHRLVVDKSTEQKVLVAAFSASETEADTGLDFPYSSLITDVRIEVVTADATETMDVGLLSSETAGDANGLLAAVPLAATGFKSPFVTSTGGSETYYLSMFWGALMGPGVVGADTDQEFGLAFVPGHAVTGSNAKSLTYTHSSGTDTAAGYIYAFFRQLR